MTVPRRGLPDTPNRKTLLAVELLDPVAQSLVYRGIVVKAAGLSSSPIVNYSGRFVWCEEGDRWPDVISVIPDEVPFFAQIEPAPQRPADLAKAKPEERLVRITLRPTPAYKFEDGVTAIRGRLCESNETDSPPIIGARVQLAWYDDTSGQWLPPKPPADAVAADDSAMPSPREAETDKDGEFAVFLRLNPPKPAQPDLEGEMLAVRLQFTRGGAVTRATPGDFPFVPATANGTPVPKGRVPEGRVLARDLKLAWTDLDPI